ncbi:MAG TPA: hypothetical protein VJU82_09860 [Acidobacteriaceae bacterium]|nr:hypothetical protein [Acidobacteriaceae bacterium]
MALDDPSQWSGFSVLQVVDSTYDLDRRKLSDALNGKARCRRSPDTAMTA